MLQLDVSQLCIYVIPGTLRHNVVYPKQTQGWVSRPIYEGTTQHFRKELMELVILRRLDPTVKYRDSTSRAVVPALAANIAKKPKPSKEEALQAHKSRFKGPAEGQ